jgi:hypothetical protein
MPVPTHRRSHLSGLLRRRTLSMSGILPPTRRRDWSRSADVILICNLVDQEIAPGGTASNAQFCAAAIQSRACLLRVIRDRCSGSCLPVDVRFGPRATYIRRCREMTRRAKNSHPSHCRSASFNYPQFRMRLRGTSGDENLNRKNPL